MKKILFKIGFGIILLATIVLISFIIWAKMVYKAEPEKFAMGTDPELNNSTFIEKSSYWEILPNPSKTISSTTEDVGFIFYPGAKVDPTAYFYKLSSLTNGQAATIKVFITKPVLNLAFFSINQADQVIKDNPEVTKWIIGGHSLGGAMACEYVKNRTNTISELWLLASYCASDISTTNLTVYSIHGSRDGVLNSQKLSENRNNLPPSAKDIVIEGMNHAEFGNYGMQSGDNTPTKSDDDVQTELIKIFKGIL